MTVTVPTARISRILDAISVLSLGNDDPKRTRITITEDDELAIVEHTINELSADLTEMRTRNRQAQETIEAQRLAIRTLAAPVIELIKRLGFEVLQKPADGHRTELERIVNELVGAGQGAAT